MKRREFITFVGGAAVALPLAASAQQAVSMRRIGVLTPFTPDDAEGKAIVSALRQGLQDLGWTEGRNIRVEYRWGGGDVERTRAYAAELVGFSPDLIFTFFNAQLAPVSRETRRSRSFSSEPRTRLERVTSPALPNRAAISRDLLSMSPRWPESGWEF